MKKLILLVMGAIMALASVVHADPLATIEEAGLKSHECVYTLIGQYASNSSKQNDFVFSVFAVDEKEALKLTLLEANARKSSNGKTNDLYVTIRGIGNVNSGDMTFKVKAINCELVK